MSELAGTVRIDQAQARRLSRRFGRLKTGYAARHAQLLHRLAHYHQQLVLAEEGLREGISRAISHVRGDSSALAHVDLTIFDTLHRLLNDVELVAVDQPVDELPAFELPTPTLLPAEAAGSLSEEEQQGLSGRLFDQDEP